MGHMEPLSAGCLLHLRWICTDVLFRTEWCLFCTIHLKTNRQKKVQEKKKVKEKVNQVDESHATLIFNFNTTLIIY